MNAIGIILVLLLLLLGIVAVGYFYFTKRTRSTAELTAVVHIFPSGKTIVEFNPYSEIKTELLVKIALLYAVKICWVLRAENPEIRNLYSDLANEIAISYLDDRLDYSGIADQLRDFAANINSVDEYPGATENGEQFTIRLVGGVSGNFINNDLPLPGLAANLPISVFLLADAVAQKLPHAELVKFGRAFASVATAIVHDSDFSLQKLNAFVIDSIERANEPSWLEMSDD